MVLVLLSAGLLLGAFGVGLLRLRIPGWQNRASLGHAAITAALGLELWAVLAFWQLEAAPGLSSGVPILGLLACGALALTAMQRGATPKAIRASRWWRAASATLAIGAMGAWWMHLESAVASGRTEVERDLIANTTTIGAFAVLGVALVALVPLLTATRSHALRRIGIPAAAAAFLALPLAIAPAAVAVDATCDASIEREGTWCREITADIPVVESYKINDRAWEPVGGPLMSTAERLRSRQEISKKTYTNLFAEGDHSGLRLDDSMTVDGYIGPLTVTSTLAPRMESLDACFVEAEIRGVVKPGTYPLGVRIAADGWQLAVTELEAGDERLQTCLADALTTGRMWPTAAGPTDVHFGLRYLGQPKEVASAG